MLIMLLDKIHNGIPCTQYTPVPMFKQMVTTIQWPTIGTWWLNEQKVTIATYKAVLLKET